MISFKFQTPMVEVESHCFTLSLYNVSLLCLENQSFTFALDVYKDTFTLLYVHICVLLCIIACVSHNFKYVPICVYMCVHVYRYLCIYMYVSVLICVSCMCVHTGRNAYLYICNTKYICVYIKNDKSHSIQRCLDMLCMRFQWSCLDFGSYIFISSYSYHGQFQFIHNS